MNPHFILFNKFQHQFIKTPTSTVLSLILNCSIIQFIHIGIHTRNIPGSQWNQQMFKYIDIIELAKSTQILNLVIFIITSIIPILIVFLYFVIYFHYNRHPRRRQEENTLEKPSCLSGCLQYKNGYFYPTIQIHTLIISCKYFDESNFKQLCNFTLFDDFAIIILSIIILIVSIFIQFTIIAFIRNDKFQKDYSSLYFKNGQIYVIINQLLQNLFACLYESNSTVEYLSLLVFHTVFHLIMWMLAITKWPTFNQAFIQYWFILIININLSLYVSFMLDTIFEYNNSKGYGLYHFIWILIMLFLLN